MPQQAFRRRSLKIGIISTVLFCSLCVGLILAACGQRAGTGAAPTAAVGAAAAEPIATPRVCSAVGCGYSLQVKFEVTVPQTYDVEVSVPGGQTLRMHCEGNSTEVIHSGLPEVVPTCLWNEGLEFYNFTPNELTLTLLAGNHRISQTFQPNYDSYYVNGPKCGPECRAAKVSFTTSLDTSPGALAQTAAARPIMLEVNRALLQATIIDATSMAVRSNSAVAPATTTALQVRLQDISPQ